MAFANLFANLSALHDDAKSPGGPAFTCRKESEKRTRGKGRKRKAEEEQPGSYNKKQRCQVQKNPTYNFKDDNIKAKDYHVPSTDSALRTCTEDEINNYSDKGAHNIRHRIGQNYKTRSSCGVNKQQHQEKKMKLQNKHKLVDKGRQTYGGGRGMLRKGGRGDQHAKQGVRPKPPRFMTQEFKDKNVLELDGRLLCRHFLRGCCIKAESCQLEHVQGYNGLLQVVCKFYVQGFCMKGESCPYMHKSFPCKFFHRNGKCSQGADCRFSHEPLNDVTNRLLDEALQRDNDLHQLAKKAEQESSGQLPNAAETEIIEANETPDVLTQPLRPNFYNSTDAAKETLLCPTEEQPVITHDGSPPHASDAAQPQTPPSTCSDHEQPVCYSVEAVLGAQLSRPFPSFFTAPGSQDSPSLSAAQTTCDATLGSTNQSQAPYSVDAVLRSFKSVEKSTFGQRSTTLPAKTVSYTPKAVCEESTKPLLSSQHEKISLKTRDEANKPQKNLFKTLPFFQSHTSLISKTGPDLSLTSEDHKNQCGDVPESVKTAQRTSHEVKLESLNSSPVTQVKKCASSKSKGDVNESQTCPAPLKPHLSGLMSDSQSPSVSLSEFKDRAAGEPVSCSDKKSDTSDSPSRHFAATKRTESGLKLGQQQRSSTKTHPERSSDGRDCGDFSDACKKNQKRDFRSLFANLSDSVMPAQPPGSIQAPRCADFSSEDLKTATEPSSTSFRCLFAAPLCDAAASSPRLESQADYLRTHLSKPRAPNLEPALPREARTDAEQTPHRPTSPNSPPSWNNEPVKQPANPFSLSEIPTSPAPQSLNPSTASAQQQLPDVSSPRGSVLKSLFLCLSPYQEDGERPDGDIRSASLQKVD